mmetsp:Transcript_61048/g.90536  ORF Transcript_61048/g.90536 Transcript_61048/m.90536 type:complete len:378 (+) Transcript_61048:91-1224(+)
MASVTNTNKTRCKRQRCNIDIDKPEEEIGGGWIKEEHLSDKNHAPYIIRCDPQIINHTKLYEGYVDDNDYAKDSLPYRYITNWFLSTLNQHSTTRMPLPKKETGFNKLYLYGELEFNPKRVQELEEEESVTVPKRRSIKVVVTKPKFWTIDMSDSLRGIWIKSNNAWYYLKQPCTILIMAQKPSDNNNKRGNNNNNSSHNTTIVTSQANLHVQFRAHLGLLSNLYDMLGEMHKEEVRTGGKFPSYVSLHKNLTPQESYNKLCPTEDDMERNPQLNSEPFDMALLRKVPTFVRKHLKQFSKELTSKCNFLVGLSDMNRELVEAKKRGEAWALDLDVFDYLKSAEQSEKRSRRYPWGEKIHKDKGMCIFVSSLSAYVYI